MSQSGDDFDDLPDPFADINWDDVPGLTHVPTTPGNSIHAIIPNRTEGIRNASNDGTETCKEPARGATPSSEYSYDDVDEAFLVEVDALEAKGMQETRSRSLSSAGAFLYNMTSMKPKLNWRP